MLRIPSAGFLVRTTNHYGFPPLASYRSRRDLLFCLRGRGTGGSFIAFRWGHGEDVMDSLHWLSIGPGTRVGQLLKIATDSLRWLPTTDSLRWVPRRIPG